MMFHVFLGGGSAHSVALAVMLQELFFFTGLQIFQERLSLAIECRSAVMHIGCVSESFACAVKNLKVLQANIKATPWRGKSPMARKSFIRNMLIIPAASACKA